MIYDYVMQTPASCGPDALWTALRNAGYGFTREDVVGAWQFPATAGIEADLRDSPGAHYRVLEALKVPYRTVTLGDVLSGSVALEQTLMLIHMGDDAVSATLHQHWIIVSTVVPQSLRVCVQWGDGTRRVLTFEQLTKYYKLGGPTATAYTLGTAFGFRSAWRMIAKAWDWLMQRFTQPWICRLVGFAVGVLTGVIAYVSGVRIP